MKRQYLLRFVRIWLHPSRIIPLIILLTAGGVVILGLLGWMQTSLVESIIIALLGLIAIDSLTERLGLLQEIKQALQGLHSGGQLRDRFQQSKLDERTRNASEIWILSLSAVSFIINNLGLLEGKVRDGCNIRFILLDPESIALETWNLLSKTDTTKNDIYNSLSILKGLSALRGAKGKCEVRLSPALTPFSLQIVNPIGFHGSIIVELYTHRTSLNDRPNIELHPDIDARWFNFFKNQFEQVWADATPVLEHNRVGGVRSQSAEFHTEN